MNIKQGEDKSFKFQILNKNGNPNIDVVNDVVFTAEKTLPCGRNIKIVKSLGNGIRFDAESYYYVMSFKPEDTINAPAGNYPFDIKVRRSDLQYFVLIEGAFNIIKSYTGVI